MEGTCALVKGGGGGKSFLHEGGRKDRMVENNRARGKRTSSVLSEGGERGKKFWRGVAVHRWERKGHCLWRKGEKGTGKRGDFSSLAGKEGETQFIVSRSPREGKIGDKVLETSIRGGRRGGGGKDSDFLGGVRLNWKKGGRKKDRACASVGQRGKKMGVHFFFVEEGKRDELWPAT